LFVFKLIHDRIDDVMVNMLTIECGRLWVQTLVRLNQRLKNLYLLLLC